MIIATEPEDSPILSKGIACKHKIMGTAPGFIPDTLDQSAYDKIIPVSTEAAFQSARQLATAEGIFCGIPAVQLSRDARLCLPRRCPWRCLTGNSPGHWRALPQHRLWA
ncbi:MAG: hypothetical protein Ct9H300mP14_15770 [Gammaproteobacteria bacterium]|nr:MAG: hypothetical protein Ct9H300mP14_15770 [Gammaproteobacteria bacterium]